MTENKLPIFENNDAEVYRPDVDSMSVMDLMSRLTESVDMWKNIQSNLSSMELDINLCRNALADRGIRITLDDFDVAIKESPRMVRRASPIAPGVPGVQHRVEADESNFGDGSQVDELFDNIDDEDFNIHQDLGSGFNTDSRSVKEIAKESLVQEPATARADAAKFQQYQEDMFDKAVSAGFGEFDDMGNTSRDKVQIKVGTRGI